MALNNHQSEKTALLPWRGFRITDNLFTKLVARSGSVLRTLAAAARNNRATMLRRTYRSFVAAFTKIELHESLDFLHMLQGSIVNITCVCGGIF